MSPFIVRGVAVLHRKKGTKVRERTTWRREEKWPKPFAGRTGKRLERVYRRGDNKTRLMGHEKLTSDNSPFFREAGACIFSSFI